MAEFDPTTPNDATEAAYARALLGDDAGREQRRARLMAALPRPEASGPVPVGQGQLAWRWQPFVLGLLIMALLMATLLVLKGRSVEPPPQADPRLAAGQPASTAVVVAQAEPTVESAPAITKPSRAAAKASPSKPRAAAPPEAVVVADAEPSRPFKESEAPAADAAAPAAPVAAAPPPPAAPMAAAAPPRLLAESAAQSASGRAEKQDTVVVSGARARITHSLAASHAQSEKFDATADAMLLAAVNRADLAAVRAALQAGASAQHRDAQGRTALMLAARTGTREVADALLAAGARKEDRDLRGWTAADHAEAQGRSDLIDLLR